MANELNKLKISKIYGIHVPDVKKLERLSKKKKETKLNICVPYEVLKDIRKRYDEYKKFMDKNRHASFPDKLKIVTGRGTLSQKENQRRDAILEAFKKVYPYVYDAYAFFIDCKGHKELQKCANQIEKDFDNMTKKGYIKNYDSEQADKFDATRYYIYNYRNATDDWPNLPTYGARAKKAYENMFNYFQGVLEGAQTGGRLLEYYNLAYAGNTMFSTEFDNIIGNIRTKLKSKKELQTKLRNLAPLVAKSGNETDKANYTALTKQLNACEEKVTMLNKTAISKYMNALFYDHKFVDDDTSPMKFDDMNQISDHIIQLAGDIDNFGKALQTNEHRYEDNVKRYFSQAIKNYKALREELMTQNVFPDQLPSPSDRQNKKFEQKRKSMDNLLKKLEKLYDDIQAALMGYTKEEQKFINQYNKMQKEKLEAKRRWRMFIIFGLFGALTGSLSKLSGLLGSLAAGPVEAPAEILT